MDKYFTPKTAVNGIKKFVQSYRQCLISIGKSPDCHIYEMDKEAFRFVKNGPSRRFLSSIIKFYNELDGEIDKKIFITEILEPGRHYRFWHYGVMESSLYRTRIQEIYGKLNTRFGLEA